jgi:hypothetical protein
MEITDKIKIDRSKFLNRIELTITIFSFIDKDTKQYIKYVPSLELSSYGKTISKANLMFEISLQEELNRLLMMSDQKAKSYLSSYGWEINPLHNKNLSHINVDKHGALEGFNVDLNAVTEEQLIRTEKITVE